MNQNEVSIAFDILLEEIEAVIESLNQEVEEVKCPQFLDMV